MSSVGHARPALPAPKLLNRAQMRRLHPSAQSGFSFVELLITAAIVLVLYALVFAPSESAMQKKHLADCAEHLRKMHISLTLYANEHNDAYPVVPRATTSEAPLSLLVPKYTTDTSVFICPGTKMAALPGGAPFEDRKISYAYFMGLKSTDKGVPPLVTDAQIGAAIKLKGDALFSADGKGAGNNHLKYGGNILYTDGHVETSTPAAGRDFVLPPLAKLLNPKP